jgi:hypothetical protein
MTLQIAINRILTMGQTHAMLASAFLGDPWELEHQQSGATKYACMMLQLTGVRFQRGQTRVDFSLYFMDQVLAEETNELPVLSDMTQVAQDVLAWMRDPSYQDWVVSDESTGQYFTERFESMVAGLRVDVAVIFEDPGDRCAVPEKE